MINIGDFCPLFYFGLIIKLICDKLFDNRKGDTPVPVSEVEYGQQYIYKNVW